MAFLVKGKDAVFFFHFFIVFFIRSVVSSEKYTVKFSCLPYFRRYFFAFNFFRHGNKFFFHKLSKFYILALYNFLVGLAGFFFAGGCL